MLALVFVTHTPMRNNNYGRYLQDFSKKSTTKIRIIEGFRGKRAYIAFLADFHFLQDRANFWQTDLF